MTALAAVNAVVRLVAAVLLLYAAVHKLAAPRAFRSTLTTLGVPWPAPVSAGVPVLELAAGSTLLSAPRSAVAAGLVAGLGVAFAVAGVLALRSGTKVKCACFGRVGAGDLGLRQIAVLPLWAGVAAVALRTPEQSPAGPAAAAAVIWGLAVCAALRVVVLMRRNREDMQAMVPQ